MTPEPEFYRPSQAARELGCSVTTILNRIKAGQIHALKVGAHFRIPRAEIERLKSEWVYSPTITF